MDDTIPVFVTILHSIRDTASLFLAIKTGLQEFSYLWAQMSIPVAERSNVRVCGRSRAGIAGSNPVGGIQDCPL